MVNKTICFTPANVDACALWRMLLPHFRIPGSRFLFTGGQPPINELLESDIICCQRMMTENNMKFLKAMRAYGMRIVYDLDDNVWTIPPHNPASAVFKLKEVSDGMEACAEWADVITVSTPVLKKVVERHWGHLKNAASKKSIPVIVCENRVDPIFYNPNPKKNDKVKIGWGGSNTHAGDLADIWNVLLKLLDKYPNVEVEIVGQPAAVNHPRLIQREWVHIADFPFYLREWNWDIFLAPLEEHKFNSSKSSIKMQEAGALARPCLASMETPYSTFVEKGDADIKWQLCSIPLQWENKLTRLIEDESFRLSLGSKMLSHTLENFNVNDSVKEWKAIAEACF